MNGEIHKLAITFKSQENPSTVQDPSVKCKTQEKDIWECTTSSAESTYLKLMWRACEMAQTSMPHKHFEVLVKCQKDKTMSI